MACVTATPLAGSSSASSVWRVHPAGASSRIHDRGLAGGLRGRAAGACGRVGPADRRPVDLKASSSQVSSAFWACSRFSAWSHTADCGPSMTLAAISSPRCAGQAVQDDGVSRGGHGQGGLVERVRLEDQRPLSAPASWPIDAQTSV